MSMSVLALHRGDRRLEAETYLSKGHDLRQGFVGNGGGMGWQKLGQIARVWQPARLKGITVGRDYGTPFLAATQVFDMRPTPRKWLSLERTDDAKSRFVTSGQILVTCSGSVGRATLAYAAHENTLITHDLLRVDPNEASRAGWLYAFLRSPQAREMMTGQKYGHIIKHLESEHLAALPVPDITDRQAVDFEVRAGVILEHRNRAHRLLAEAEELYAKTIGPVPPNDKTERGFTVRASSFFTGRRRLEANYHNPTASDILARFQACGFRTEPLGSVTERVWWMNRFKRHYGPSGIPYLSADELFTLNPEEQKRIIVGENDGHNLYFAEPGWLLMACSGQIYGLNGAVCLTTDAHTNTFFSHDLIRIRPKDGGPRPGYLATAFSHPTLGRPLLIREAYGTSIPHLDPTDVAAFPLVRLDPKLEEMISELAEMAAEERGVADIQEKKLAEEAGVVVENFLAKSALGPVAVTGSSTLASTVS